MSCCLYQIVFVCDWCPEETMTVVFGKQGNSAKKRIWLVFMSFFFWAEWGQGWRRGNEKVFCLLLLSNERRGTETQKRIRKGVPLTEMTLVVRKKPATGFVLKSATQSHETVWWVILEDCFVVVSFVLWTERVFFVFLKTSTYTWRQKGESRVFEVVPFHIHAAGRSARSFPRKRQSKWAGVLRRTFNRNPPSGNTGRRCPCGASVWCVSFSRGQRRLFFLVWGCSFFVCIRGLVLLCMHVHLWCIWDDRRLRQNDDSPFFLSWRTRNKLRSSAAAVVRAIFLFFVLRFLPSCRVAWCFVMLWRRASDSFCDEQVVLERTWTVVAWWCWCVRVGIWCVYEKEKLPFLGSFSLFCCWIS